MKKLAIPSMVLSLIATTAFAENEHSTNQESLEKINTACLDTSDIESFSNCMNTMDDFVYHITSELMKSTLEIEKRDTDPTVPKPN